MKCGGISWVLAAQLIAAPGYAQTAGAEKLNITVVEGEGAINNIRQRTARDIIVQVDDENRRPVAGASVVFTLPSQGAGGTLAGGHSTYTATTDSQGRAVARGFRPNSVAGKMEIRVNASAAGRTGRATITQFNMTVDSGGEPRKSGSRKLIAILAIGAAAAAGGAIAATRGGSSGAAAAPTVPVITLVPGTGTLGPPQ